jgi:hypothetical protein
MRRARADKKKKILEPQQGRKTREISADEQRLIQKGNAEEYLAG